MMLLDIDLRDLGPHSLDEALPATGTTTRPGLLWQGQHPAARLAWLPGRLLILIGQPEDAGGTARCADDLLAGHTDDPDGFANGLRGSYALALLDARKGRLLLSNDRMAVHTWCYTVAGKRFRLALRADALGVPDDVSPQAIYSYFFNHVIPSPQTVYGQVRRLPPAHRLCFDAAGVEVQPRWQPRFEAADRPDFSALREEFLQLLERGVRKATAGKADKQLGAFLSGGTDSSTVCGLLQRVTDTPVRAYSIGFDAEGYDEMAYARIAARHFGLDHREYYLSPQDVVDGIPRVAAYYDQPFGNSSAVAAYHCARVAASEGRSLLLAGDGGDELFGGNARYAKQTVFGWYAHVPEPLRRMLIEPVLGDDNRLTRLPGIAKAASYVHQARIPMPDRLQMYNLLERVGLPDMLSPSFIAQIAPEQERLAQRAWYAATPDTHLLNRMLAFDWKYTLADSDLPKVCGSTDLAGIAVAFPLLSDDLIDFSTRLPVNYKLRGLKLRWFFKEALRGFLPDEILTKRKQGFGLPFGVWAIRHPQLAALADDSLASFANRGVIRQEFIKKLRNELLPAHPGYYGELVWIITMLEHWLRAKAPNWRVTA